MQKNLHNRCLLLEFKRKLVNQAASSELNLQNQIFTSMILKYGKKQS